MTTPTQPDPSNQTGGASRTPVMGKFLRWFVRSSVSVYYSNIEVTNRENSPATGSVLYLANHPNSLIDPVIIGIAAQRPVHFLAKAPLFEIPLFGSLLRAFGMLPAYRGSDDRSAVGKNVETLASGARFLARGDAVGLFPEGKTHDALRVEMVRSGAARIAIQAVHDGANKLLIVPLGLNYEQKERFRSCIWVRVGKPIDVQEWLKKSTEDEHKAMRELTHEIDRRLKELVIHFKEDGWEPFLSDLEVLFPATRLHRRDSVATLRQRKGIADAMNHYLETDRPRAEAIAQKIRDYRTELGRLGLTTRSPLVQYKGWRLFFRQLVDLFWAVLWGIPAILGTLFHLIPFALVRAIGPRIQDPGRATTAMTRLGLGFPIYGLWYAWVIWKMTGYFLPWVVWTWNLAMPLAGLLALDYWPRLGRLLQLWWKELKTLLHRKQLKALRRQRDELHGQIQKLATEYEAAHPATFVKPKPRSVGRKIAWSLATATVIFLSVLAYYSAKDRTLQEFRSAGPDLSLLSKPLLEQNLNADEMAMAAILSDLKELEKKSLALRNEFASGKRSFYHQADNDLVRQQLLAYLNYRKALLRIIWNNQNFAKIGDERLKARAYLVGNTAAAALYQTSLKFVTEFGKNPLAARKLNEGEPLWGIPDGLYDMIERNLRDPHHHRMMVEGFARYHEELPKLQKLNLTDSAPYSAFHDSIRRAEAAIPTLEQKLAGGKITNAAGDVRDVEKLAVYRTKTLVSTWIGDLIIRAPRQGQRLVRPELVEQLRTQLKPGDILLERHNWHLSNAFLPGYWPHAAIYVGTPQDLARLGLDKDPSVKKHWEEFCKPDIYGHSNCILEALSEGVIYNSMEHSVGECDSLAVFRPHLEQKQINAAIARAFSHAGKPYDFEFDFFSTDKLVCTELVFRTYDGVIDFPLVDILGTKTLPAIEIVRKFSADSKQGKDQLDFVAFIDGNEAIGKAKFRDSKALVGTLDRPALTWLQPNGPE